MATFASTARPFDHSSRYTASKTQKIKSIKIAFFSKGMA
jgi:hypothetical protein